MHSNESLSFVVLLQRNYAKRMTTQKRSCILFFGLQFSEEHKEKEEEDGMLSCRCHYLLFCYNAVAQRG
jgi:hypothetical protein